MKHNYNFLHSQYGKSIYKSKHLPFFIKGITSSFFPTICLVALQKGMHSSSCALNEQIGQ